MRSWSNNELVIVPVVGLVAGLAAESEVSFT